MKKTNILIVDDNEDNRETLKDVLTDRGCNVETVGDGKSAIELVKKQDFNVVFLDVKLPEMDGMAVLEKIKELKPDLEVVMMSGYTSGYSTEDEYAKEAYKRGAGGYLYKPFDFEKIFSVIDKVSGEKVPVEPANSILLVDDEKGLKDFIKGIVKDKEYEIVQVGTFREAMEELNKKPFKLALVSINFTRKDEIEMVKEIKRAHENLRILLITDYASLKKVVDAVKNCIYDRILVKPLEMDKVKEYIEQESLKEEDLYVILEFFLKNFKT